MARMLPPEVHADTRSRAESKLFGVIRAQLGDDWTALHSLGLTSHRGKPWAEIDYVLVGRAGVFCLEVKGGRVSRVDGYYHYTDGQGNTSVSDRGPFEQVGPAAAALYRHLVEADPHLRAVVVGYGVLTPDVRFEIEGPDVEPRVVYDVRDRAASFGSYMRRLIAYWHERIEMQTGRTICTVDDRTQQEIVQQLRGDFDLRPSLQMRAGQVNEDLIRLTEEQYGVLDAFGDNDRVFVRGGAGTGKTLLAIEEARRNSVVGKRVFLCCFNKGLAGFLQSALNDCNGVRVEHLHGYMADVVRRAGLTGRLPRAEARDLFAVFYPELALEAILALDEAESYDILIVDEGQDLMLDPYVSVLDAVLMGGVDRGTWRLFADPNQGIFEASSASCVRRIMDTRPAQVRLTLNCRNTRPIATATRLLSGLGGSETLRADGPEVQVEWYGGRGEERRKVSKCVNALLGGGLAPTQIVLLSTRSLANTALDPGLVDCAYSLCTGDQGGAVGRPTIRFSTVGAFKGLESDAVVFVDVEDLETNSSLMDLYVGASRARAFLTIFMHESLREAYALKAFEFGKQMRVAVDGDGRQGSSP